MKSLNAALTAIALFVLSAMSFAKAAVPNLPVKGSAGYTMIDVGVLYGTDATRAVGVNNVGEIAVNSWAQNGAARWATVVRFRNNHPFISRKLAPVTGFTDSYANDINNSGMVVGSSTDYSVGGHHSVATVWNANGRVVRLVNTPAPSEAMAVNDNGDVVVWTPDMSFVIRPYAPTIKLECYGMDTWGFSINNNGFVSGVTAVSDGVSFDYYPTVWDRFGRVVFIDDTPGQMTCLNDWGIGCGTVGNSPAVWFGGGALTLSLPKGYDSGDASSLNNTDAIVGSVSSGSQTVACVWSTFRCETLPTPRGFNSYAVGVNDAGIVVGDFFTEGPGSAHAVVWVPMGRM